MRARLSILYFLQFGVWGCYLTCFGQLLGAGGLGRDIAWFYATVGIVSIITPALMGHLADRCVKPVTLLAICHGVAAAAMTGAWIYAQRHPVLEFRVFFPLYLLFLAFYMPTMALANTVSFGILKSRGQRPVDAFPSIRVWGTVGFVAAMWFVNCAYWHDGVFGFAFSDLHPAGQFRFQFTSMQLLCAGIMGVMTALYALSLPHASLAAGEKNQGRFILLQGSLWRKFFGNSTVRIFLVFAALSGVCMQISNGFATPFISHFTGISEYVGSHASGNATMLFSLSQISEALCLLLVGGALKKYGIRTVFAVGGLAWGLRFLFFSGGNPSEGLWMLVASMLVYGIGFNFITIAGHLYMEQVSEKGTVGFGQGVMMLMSNGVGATAGTLVAGSIINHCCHWEMVEVGGGSGVMRLFMGEWQWPWLIFGIYALLMTMAWLLFFKKKRGVATSA